MKTENKDPMAVVLLLVGLAAIGVVLWFMVSNLLYTINKNSTRGADSEDNLKVQHALVADRMQKIGFVKAGFVPKVPPVRTGKQIVADVCGECHVDGSMGAPMIGTKDWAKRYSRGFESLLHSAQNGKGDMPARGDDPSLTDKDLMKAIAYMLKESGLNPPVIEDDKKKEGDKKEDGAAKGDAPANGAVDSAAPAPAPAAAPAAGERTSAFGAPRAERVAIAGDESPDYRYNPFYLSEVPSEKKGEVVFESACIGCHDFLPPRIGVKEEWRQVSAKGMDVVYRNTLLGTFRMPPKGGRLDLADEDIRASVDYMAARAQ